jgi:hypothetical protein
MDSIEDTIDYVGDLESSIDNFQEENKLDVDVRFNANKTLSGKGLVNGSGVQMKAGGSLDALIASFPGGAEDSMDGGVEGGASWNSTKKKSMKTMKKLRGGAMAMNTKVEKILQDIDTRVFNLNQLKGVLHENFKGVVDKLKSCNKHDDVEKFEKLEKAVIEEIDSQIEFIKNGLKQEVEPVKHQLSDFIDNNKQFTDIIKNIGFDIGELNASNGLSIVFSNINEMERITKNVSKALKELNMKESEYKEIESKKDLDRRISDLLKSMIKSDNVTQEDIKKIVDAMDTLSETFKHHDTISKMLSSKAGGARMEMSNKLTSRLKNQKHIIKSIVNKFLNALGDATNQMGECVDAISEHVGKSIPYSDTFTEFVDSFRKFNRHYDSKLYTALLGIDISEVSNTEKREQFIRDIRDIQKALGVLKSQSNIPVLTKLDEALGSMLQTIDSYSDLVKSSFNELRKGGSVSDMAELFNPNAGLINVSTMNNIIDKINSSAKKMEFYGNIATIRSNLVEVEKEYGKYQKDYLDSVGKSVGAAISSIQSKYAEFAKQVDNTKSGLGLEIDIFNRSLSNTDREKRISKEALKQIFKYQSDARVGLYRTIEAIDMYLMHFTDSLVKSPDSLIDLDKMISATKIIAKWFHDKSGQNLLKVFASFPRNGEDAGTQAFIDRFKKLNNDDISFDEVQPDLWDTYIAPGQAKVVFERCKTAVEGIVVLKNILSYFVHIGEKFGQKTIQNSTFMSPINIYKNLVNYIWASALIMSDDILNEKLDDDNNIKRKFRYENAMVKMAMISNVNPEEFGLNSSNMSVDKLKVLRIQNEIANYGTYVHSYRGPENEDGLKKTRTLLKTIVTIIYENERWIDIIDIRYPDLVRMAIPGIRSGPKRPLKDILDDIHNMNSDDIDNLWNGRFYAAPQYRQSENYDAAGLVKSLEGLVQELIKELNQGDRVSDPFRVDDTYFVLTIKAIAGKVFTVAGLYGVFKHPGQYKNTFITNPARRILGGNDTFGSSEIIEEATELYIRLPLLLEFYRNVFYNGNKELKTNNLTEPDNEIISYVPEVGNIWGGIIGLIFDRSNFMSSGVFSDDVIRKMISHINTIYHHYKQSAPTSENLTRYILLQLVNEVNRRYGVIKRQELSDFYRAMSNAKKGFRTSDNANDFIDLDILDDTNDYDTSAPSDMYIKIKESTALTNEEKLTTLTEYKILKNFRAKINNILNDAATHDLFSGQTSFKDKIKMYKKNIMNSSISTSDKYKIIFEAIQQSRQLTESSSDINMAFHELVVAPLELLSHIYAIVHSFITAYYFTASKLQPRHDNSDLDAKLGTLNSNYLMVNSDITTTTGGNISHSIGSKSRGGPEVAAINLIKQLSDISANLTGLVKISFGTHNTISLDFSVLQQHCEKSLSNIKHMIGKFSALMDPMIIRKFEKTDTYGSVYNLEARFNTLFNKFNDYEFESNQDPYGGSRGIIIDIPSEFINKTLENLGTTLTAETLAKRLIYLACRPQSSDSNYFIGGATGLRPLEFETYSDVEEEKSDDEEIYEGKEDILYIAETAPEFIKQETPDEDSFIGYRNDMIDTFNNVYNIRLNDFINKIENMSDISDEDKINLKKATNEAYRLVSLVDTLERNLTRVMEQARADKESDDIEKEIDELRTKLKEIKDGEEFKEIVETFKRYRPKTDKIKLKRDEISEGESKYMEKDAAEKIKKEALSLSSKVEGLSKKIEDLEKKIKSKIAKNIFARARESILFTMKSSPILGKPLLPGMPRSSAITKSSRSCTVSTYKSLECLPVVRDTFTTMNKYGTLIPLYNVHLSNLVMDVRMDKTIFNSGYGENYTLVRNFNRLIIDYLNQLYDNQTKKIYGKLFETFASETFASALEGNCIFDILGQKDLSSDPIDDINKTIRKSIVNIYDNFNNEGRTSLPDPNGNRVAVDPALGTRTIDLNNFIKHAYELLPYMDNLVGNDGAYYSQKDFQEDINDLIRAFNGGGAGVSLINWRTAVNKIFNRFSKLNQNLREISVDFNKAQTSYVAEFQVVSDPKLQAFKQYLRDYLPFPKDRLPLSAINAVVLRNLSNRMSKNQSTKFHQFNTINEVNAASMEKYRGKLPTFIRLFENLVQKALFYRQLLTRHCKNSAAWNNIQTAKTNVDTIRDYRYVQGDYEQPNMIIYDPVPALDASNPAVYTTTGDVSDLIRIVDNVIEGSRSLINDAKSVLEEVYSFDGVSPVYFNTKRNFAKNFYQNTGKLPFMPLSLMNTSLSSSDLSARTLVPTHIPNIVTTNQSKLLYGSSLIMSEKNDYTSQQFSYVKQVADVFNGYNGTQGVEENKLEEYIQVNTTLMRYFIDVQYYSLSFKDPMYFTLQETSLRTYESDKGLQETISLVDSMNPSDSKNKVSTFIQANKHLKGTDSNRYAIVANLSDMNIVPINMHALMREVPLIHIYNYASVFEDIVLSPNQDYGIKDKLTDVAQQLLIDPYAEFKTNRGVMNLNSHFYEDSRGLNPSHNLARINEIVQNIVNPQRSLRFMKQNARARSDLDYQNTSNDRMFSELQDKYLRDPATGALFNDQVFMRNINAFKKDFAKIEKELHARSFVDSTVQSELNDIHNDLETNESEDPARRSHISLIISRLNQITFHLQGNPNNLIGNDASRLFNSKLMRNILFLVNVQNAIQYKVKRELEFINTKVVTNFKTISEGIVNDEESKEFTFEF